MIWEVESRGAKRVSEIAKAVKGAEKLILATDPDREGEAISWHVVEALQREARAEGHAGRARHLQRHHQGRGAERACGSRARSTRRWSTPTGAPRPRLSRRLQPVAGAVAQAPGRALGRPRAVGGAAARLRPRARDREVRRRRNTGRWSRRWRRRTAASSTRGSSAPTASKIQRLDIGKGEEAEAFKRDLELATFTVAKVEAKPAKRHPCAALHDLDPAAGGLAQARARAGADHAHRAASLRGRRDRRRDGRAHHLHAHGRRRHGAGGDRRARAPSSPRNTASAICPDVAAPLRDEGEERAGGARGDPPDRYGPHALVASRKLSRAGAGQALRADLDPHRREPDGIGRAGAHHGRHRRRASVRAGSTCARPARS